MYVPWPCRCGQWIISVAVCLLDVFCHALTVLVIVWSRLSGGASVLCLSTAISCPELASPENGHLELSNGFLFQSEGKFTCDNGYVLDGGSLIHCEADKTWNGSASLCVGEYVTRPGIV